jgi:hypothetical protein
MHKSRFALFETDTKKYAISIYRYFFLKAYEPSDTSPIRVEAPLHTFRLFLTTTIIVLRLFLLKPLLQRALLLYMLLKS